jgi:D-sedoheptulose 7-phosphate isomerase|tara:strand:+ start:108 stop:686 length:579 start_codon:yes stop_codon:yes gene_type:complete
MSELFLKQYIKDYSDLILPEAGLINTLMQVKDALVKASENGKKVIIVGNGGSAAMASHISVDLTKNAGIRSINFNEPDLITCFANDYGYEHWLEKAVEFYGDKGDVFIGISSSGSSENILNGCRAAREKKFSKVITFSGMNFENPLRKLGDINLWVNSKAYNHIENIHQFWLLAIVDVIIGKTVYSSNPDAS